MMVEVKHSRGKTKFLIPPLIGVLLMVGLASLKAWSQDSVKPAEKVPIAFIYAKTGSDLLVERELKKGMDVFQVVFPEALQKVQLNIFDHQGSLESTQRLLKLIKEKEYPFVVGIRNNNLAMVASDFIEKNDQLFVTPLATLSKISLGKKNTFQLGPNEVLQGAALARYASLDLKRKRTLVLVNHRSLYSQALADSFEKSFNLIDKNVRIFRHISNEQDLYLDSLKELVKKNKPDIVFISDDISQSAVLAKYIHRIDPMIPFISGDLFGHEAIVSALLKEVPKIRVYYLSLWNENEENELMKKFKETYQNKWPGSSPSLQAAMVFDSLLVLSQAIELAGSPVDINKVRYFLEHNEFKTTQGPFSFAGAPTHSPIKNVHIKVSNIRKNKWVKSMRVKWRENP